MVEIPAWGFHHDPAAARIIHYWPHSGFGAANWCVTHCRLTIRRELCLVLYDKIVSTTKKLDRTLVSGIAWTAMLRWVAQGLSWCATFFVARLLVPGDYGIVSMATIGIGLLRMVEDFGLDSILIQDRSIVGEQQARLAGLILTVGAGFCAIFLLLAQPIAVFFHEAQVRWAIVGLSVLFVTDALQVVPRATLQRELDFRRFAMLAFVQTLATQSVLVAAAEAKWGYWALISGSIAGGVASTVLLLAWRPYRVAWPRELAKLARPLLQGWRVIAGRIAWYGFNTADQTIAGRMLGKDALGAYSFATTFASLPFQEAGSIVGRVVPGIFSVVQTNPVELRRYFLMLTEFLTYITLPLSVGLALTGDLAVGVALGPQWTAVVQPLRLLCVYAAFQGCQILVSHVLMWTGQFRTIMWCTILAAVAMPLGFLGAASHGLPGLALVWAVLYPIVNIPPLVIGFRIINVSLRDWLAALKPAACASLVMIAAVLAVRRVLPASQGLLTSLVMVVTVGAVAYAAVLWFAFRARVLEILRFVRPPRDNPLPAAEVP